MGLTHVDIEETTVVRGAGNTVVVDLGGDCQLRLAWEIAQTMGRRLRDVAWDIELELARAAALQRDENTLHLAPDMSDEEIGRLVRRLQAQSEDGSFHVATKNEDDTP